MKRNNIVLFVILFIAAFLRFYNLMFDSPFFFHPDEKNMAIAVIKLNFPKNLNPHFFAYGQFPLYLSYFSGYLSNIVTHRSISYLNLFQAIFWLRFWSATASTLSVLLVFLISRQLFRNCKLRIENLAALLAAFTPGLIQSAHFGTTESLLTFFFLALIYLSILYSSEKILASCFLLPASLILGLSLSTKVTALIYLLIPFLAILLRFKKNVSKIFIGSFLLLTFSFLIFIVASPFTFLDFKSFYGSMNYETSVALGKIKVFYTRQFENTVPILFQLEKIFPYTLGWPMFILGLIGFLLSCITLIFQLITQLKDRIKNQELRIKEKRNTINHDSCFLILNFALLIYFLPNAFLFAKWTRFISPIFPLFAVFTGYFIYKIKQKRLVWLLTSISVLPGIIFFSIYLKPDVRVTASQWIYENIPANSYILSETANVVDIPVIIQNPEFRIQNYEIVSFDFYDLDENPLRFEELLSHLTKADYIFVPSRRVFANHMRLPNKYPILTKYYQLLFSGKLGFEKVTEFRSPGRWPQELLPGCLDDEQAEETFTVFDHPVIRIYKKTKEISAIDYRKLLID